jgi:hypothetical protein
LQFNADELRGATPRCVFAMRVVKRLAAALVAVVALLGVVYLGGLSGREDRSLFLFGIVAALVAPMVLGLIEYALSLRDRH